MAVVDVLKRRYAFADGNVRLLTNATHSDILQALGQLNERIKSKDSVLIFYAGHGYLNEETDEAFWIPVDASGMNEAGFLSHDTIKRKMSNIAKNANNVLLVSDSCFSGLLVRQVRGVDLMRNEVTPGYYIKKAKQKSVQVVAAGGDEFVDEDYLGTGHSPFTYFFINELLNNTNRYLAVSEFINKIEKNVANRVEQTPVMGRLTDTMDNYGEFIFTQIELTGEELQKEIDQYLASAEKLFKQKQFIRPEGNNARYKWNEVLLLDPNNSSAKKGLERIAYHYITKAENERDNRRYAKAKESLQVAEDVVPDFPPIEPVRKSIRWLENYVSPPPVTW